MRAAVLLLLLAGAGATAAQTLAPPHPTVDPEVIARSDALADRFQHRLQPALRSAIAEQRLPGAVFLCSTPAPATAPQ